MFSVLIWINDPNKECIIVIASAIERKKRT